ncbi:MAG TPA: alpha/beta fold hydrolase [Candidatus Obscuribacterales bacterium]
MKQSDLSRLAVSAFCALALTASALPGLSAEITIPSQVPVNLKPELAAKFTYIEDGEFTNALKIPTYQWMPVNREPQAIVLGVHGLTLHGRRFWALARTFAVSGIGFVSFDMRGFGRCRFDDNKQFSTDKENRRKISHEKSYEDLVALANLVRQKYPNKPIVVLGESLGCTFCVRLAAEHKDLVDGIILSAPAVKVNARMWASPGEVERGIKAVISPTHKVNLNAFITKLVSQRQEVIKEMLDDPLVLKQVSLLDLISTDEFVEKTAKYGKGISDKLPILILQGGGDFCVAPKAVTDLMSNMPSTDQTLRWLGNIGHLQLETSYIRSLVIDAIGDWIQDHSDSAKVELQALEQAIKDTGGTLVE